MVEQEIVRRISKHRSHVCRLERSSKEESLPQGDVLGGEATPLAMALDSFGDRLQVERGPNMTMLCTNAASSSVSATPETKDLSIFKMSIGNCRR